ncbi:MAG: hypothetical protein HY812_21255 [Planctomycetes bacterium]|nr:hypothetical protein [Planctomycetota bacterium]
MKRRTLPPPAVAAAVLCFLLQGGSNASTLTIDGRKYRPDKLMGDPITVAISGAAGVPATLLVDVSPGPTVLYGQTLPLGFTPALVLIPLPAIPAGGTLEFSATVPSLPALHGLSFYLLAAVHDPSFPFALDFSNGAQLVIKDRNIQLAGNSLTQYPYFEHVRAVNQGAPVELGIDPTRYPLIIGQSADVYVVQSKTKAEWLLNAALVDVTGGAKFFTFAGGTIQANTLTLDTGTLSGNTGGTDMGVPYDVVIDFNQDGLLNGTDLIDGYGDEAGFYVVHDIAAAGPLAVKEILYNVGISFGGQNTYYPVNIASLGQLPLVVVSHGNGHNYQWYDHIGYHLASYGYIVMSHQNNTVPGSHTAAITTLANTDEIIGQQATIDGGAMNGHIDSHRITWIGHSRGGDGVVRAYDKLFDGTYTPVNYTIHDVALVSSIAPVDFGGFSDSHPHGANYHLWVGQADADVTGCASLDEAQWYNIHDRAEQIRQSVSFYGVGHGDFHDGGGSSVASGPCLVGRALTHDLMRGYLLALVKHHIEGNVPAKDYLWRQFESFHPIGAPATNPCVHVNLMYRDGAASGKYVIDDFQTNSALNKSSSGGSVSFTVTAVTEGNMDDANSVFTNDASDLFNGFTNDGSGDSSRGLVFTFDGAADYRLTFNVLSAASDISGYEYLSFRAAQGTRHPLNTAFLGDTTFDVALIDRKGVVSVIDASAFGGGLEEPYQRTSCGSGAGWNTEFETVRIRLDDFMNNGCGVDLTGIAAIEFRFGPSHGTPQGRLGIDDLELTTD